MVAHGEEGVVEVEEAVEGEEAVALVEEEPEEGGEQLVVKEPCVEEELLQE